MSTFPFVDIHPITKHIMRSLLSPQSVLDILRAISQLCHGAGGNQIEFNPGIGSYCGAVLYLLRSQLWLLWDGRTGGVCKLANHIDGLTQKQASLANQPVAKYVVRCLLASSHTSFGALSFRLFPSGIRLSMISVCFQHASVVARVQAGRECDVKRLLDTNVPGL